jgi:hypothetical protein
VESERYSKKVWQARNGRRPIGRQMNLGRVYSKFTEKKSSMLELKSKSEAGKEDSSSQQLYTLASKLTGNFKLLSGD